MIKYRKLKAYKYQLTSQHTLNLPRGESLEMSVRNINHPFIKIKEVKQDKQGILRKMVIKKGYCWDGCSGPTIDTRSNMRAGLIHDVFFQMIREGFLEPDCKDYADKLFRDICIEDGMSKLRAWYYYKAVKWFGGKYCKPKGD